MTHQSLIKRLFVSSAVATAVLGISAAPAAASTARVLGQCTVSVEDPQHAGDYVWGNSPWNCSLLPPDGGAKIYLKIYRDGALVKSSEFWQGGAFNLTASTGVRCVGGTHTYYVHSHGWDSDHISYNVRSRDVSLPC
jgi:hypothetical protein